jgi:hypothetical protein
MTTTTYRNDSNGYWVTLEDRDNVRCVAIVTDSLGYRFPMIGADYPHAATLARSRAHNNGATEVPPVAAPAPAASPLAVDVQVRSARPLASNTTGLPTFPQARAMAVAIKWTPEGRPATIQRCARTNLALMIAMSRRGWLDLDHQIRPTEGCVTDAGRRALAAYVAKHGEVL